MKIKEALKLFREKLLSTSSAPYIMKIIHFGSTAKGKAKAESDVDVLIISSDGEIVKDTVAEIAFSMQMDFGVPIEPLVEDLDEFIFPTSYFIFNIINYGKEVYSVEKEVLKREAETNLVRLAEEYLKGAEEAAKLGYLRLAVDAAYNAAELGVKALILKKIDDLPGSHGGVVGKFGELYIKTKELSEELGRKLNRALELRNFARYKYQATIREEDANSVLELAKTIIDKALPV